MRQITTALLILTLSGCGLETATTAATGAAAKKQEIEQGKKTLEQTQRKIDQAIPRGQQRTQDADAGER
jgi:uncharacterized protein YceK